MARRDAVRQVVLPLGIGTIAPLRVGHAG